jgi:hypothetical protein
MHQPMKKVSWRPVASLSCCLILGVRSVPPTLHNTDANQWQRDATRECAVEGEERASVGRESVVDKFAFCEEEKAGGVMKYTHVCNRPSISFSITWRH